MSAENKQRFPCFIFAENKQRFAYPSLDKQRFYFDTKNITTSKILVHRIESLAAATVEIFQRLRKSLCIGEVQCIRILPHIMGE